MTSATLHTLPTCGAPFALLAPYDADLANAFTVQLANLQSAVVPNTCQCATSANDLGYTQNLTSCVECAASVPTLEAFWGCSTCETLVAPVWLYTKGFATPENLRQFQTNPTYQAAVESAWSSASDCQRATAIKTACISASTYQLLTPNPPAPTPTPTPPAPTPSIPDDGGGGGLSGGAIAGIVIGTLAGLLLLIGLVAVFSRGSGRRGGPLSERDQRRNLANRFLQAQNNPLF